MTFREDRRDAISAKIDDYFKRHLDAIDAIMNIIVHNDDLTTKTSPFDRKGLTFDDSSPRQLVNSMITLYENAHNASKHVGNIFSLGETTEEYKNVENDFQYYISSVIDVACHLCIFREVKKKVKSYKNILDDFASAFENECRRIVNLGIALDRLFEGRRIVLV